MIDKLPLPCLAKSDIVIAGAGPAGLSAAIAAARQGFQVLLLEQTGALGGMATSGLVPMFAPSSDGIRVLYGGIFPEIHEEMCHRMKCDVNNGWQIINAEILKYLLDEKIRAEKNIKVFFNVKVCEAEVTDGRINALLCATSQGLKRVEGKQFIDATGDGLLAMLAGAEFQYGDSDGNTQAPTMCCQYSNIDYEKEAEAAKKGIYPHTCWYELLKTNTAPLMEHHLACVKRTSPGTSVTNYGHVYGADTLDESGLTECYFEGRRQAHIFEEFFRTKVPGYENAELVNTAALMGIRETRRIVGEYQLTANDYFSRADFEDEIGRCSYPVDRHAATKDATAQNAALIDLAASKYQKGESYGIPYRVMIPKGLKNLLVPGRALSADQIAQASVRIMPACFVTGQAAGIAAGLADNGDVRDISMKELQTRLVSIGAIIGKQG